MRYGQSTTRVTSAGTEDVLIGAIIAFLVSLSLLKSKSLIMVYASRTPLHEAVEKRKLQSFYTARPNKETKT
jgi:hypothetical protein